MYFVHVRASQLNLVVADLLNAGSHRQNGRCRAAGAGAAGAEAAAHREKDREIAVRSLIFKTERQAM